MANYSTTKASIDANVIPYNNAQLITGEKMNSVLKEIVDNMGGQGYLFKGIASPSDPAITTDARVFFFATTPGAYTNKGGVVVNSGELAIITYDTIWNKSVVCYGLTSTELAKLRNLPTVIELESALNGKVDKVTGKSLSTNDYTDEDKAKLAGLEPVTISQNAQAGGVDIKVGGVLLANVASQEELTFATRNPIWSAGYIWGANGNVQSTSSVNKKTDYIDVSGYKRIVFLGNYTPTTADPGYYFYAADNTPISGAVFDTSGAADRQAKEYEVEIPSNAKYFRTSIYNEFFDQFYLKLFTDVALAPRIDKVEAEVESITPSIKSVNDIVEQTRIGFYIYDNGIWVAAAEGGIIIPVNPSTEYTIEAGSVNAVNFRFLASFPAEIVAGGNPPLCEGETSTRVVSKNTTKKIVSPADAHYLCYSNYQDRAIKSITYISTDVAKRIDAIEPIANIVDSEKEIQEVKYNPFNLIAGFAKWQDGTIVSSSTTYHTPHISTIGKNTIRLTINMPSSVISDGGICFYDENDNFLIGYPFPTKTSGFSEIQWHTYAVPANAAYCVSSIYRGCQFRAYLYNSEVSALHIKSSDLLVGTPKLHISESITDTYTNINTKTTAELYAEYDALATAHPNYFRRLTDIGEVTRESDSEVFEIRQYELGWNKQVLIDHEPTSDEIISANNWTSYLSTRKVLLNSGMHGEEHTPCWGMMLAIKDILESDEDWAMFIKSNFIFKIIPCLNPRGWDICTRGNTDGVILNRDEAIDAPESTAYMDWVEANKDAFILLDIHGTQGRYAYMPVANQIPIHDLICRFASKLSAQLYPNWKEFYDAQSEGYGTTYAPMLVAKDSGHSYTLWTRGHYVRRMYEDYGMQEFAIETPDNLTQSGLIGNNDLRNCKLTKDMFINALQYICSLKQLPM